MFLIFDRDGTQTLPANASHHHQRDGSVRVEFIDGRVEVVPAPTHAVEQAMEALGCACEIDFMGDSIRVRTACLNCGCVKPTPQTRADLGPVCDDCGHSTEITAEQTTTLVDALAPLGFVLTAVNE